MIGLTGISIKAKRSAFWGSALVLACLIFPHSAIAQSKEEKARIDSVFQVIPKMKEDTATVNYINKVYFNFLWRFDLPEAYNQLKYALRLARKLDYLEGEYSSYGNMAGYAIRTHNPEYALQHRFKALDAATRLRDSVKMASQWYGIGICYQNMDKHGEALKYHLSAKRIIERSGNKDKIARFYAQIGAAYHKAGEDSLAIHYLGESLRLRKEIGYMDGVIACNIMLRGFYLDRHEYDKALAHTQDLLVIDSTSDNTGGVAANYLAMGNIYQKKKEPRLAEEHFNKALRLALEVDDRSLLCDIYGNLAPILRSKNSTQAFAYLKRHLQLKDSLKALELKKQVENVKALLDVESRNQELELLSKDAEITKLELEKKEGDISTQRKALAGLGAALLAITGLMFRIAYGYREKKKLAAELSRKKKIIEEKNKDITDSIRYAERIQQAIQPPQKALAQAVPKSFIFYRPKDIVSGDFYWFAQKGNYVFIAAADCTGHGVPGALMSMVGLNFLNQAVTEKGLEDTSAILEDLHYSVVAALKKNESTASRDGMDIALLRIDTLSREVQFSGAARPLCMATGNQVQLIKGDKYSIGGIKRQDDPPFSSVIIQPDGPASFYLFSDGFADQFGGPKGKKFMMKNLQELLNSVQSLPMNKQSEEIANAFGDWKKDTEQVDDVLVIGVRI
jgi:serine phosphatase RsbU (regulator of sigma subunit)